MPLHPVADRTFELYLRLKRAFEPVSFRKTVLGADRPLKTCLQLALATIRRTQDEQ
jgi:hypothetical protein